MTVGYFALILHSHLPYVVGHGKWPHGTDWLNEAAAETYLPILAACDQLVESGLSPKFSVDISPILCEQLASGAFKSEFDSYLAQKIEAAGRDASEFHRLGQADLVGLAQYWQEFYRATKTLFAQRYHQDIVGRFRQLQDEGHLEILTCAATHAYLPLLSQDSSCRAQVKQAIVAHQRFFGKTPRGIWLPECAYRPAYKWKAPVEVPGLAEAYSRRGVEEVLSEEGLEYFVIDSATLKGGRAVGVYIDRFQALKDLWKQFEKQYHPPSEDEVRSPLEVYLVGSSDKMKPVAVFTRHPDVSLQVWSAEWGYPGDGNYLDFHKKRYPGGHRYWRVTSPKSDLAEKKIYDPGAVESRLEENSTHFASLICDILGRYYKASGKPGILVAPFDAELFGHWWFEGPRFLRKVIEKVAAMDNISCCTLGEYYDMYKPTKVVSLPEGSWGEGGHHYIWLNQWTRWTWKHIYEDELIMKRLVERHRGGKGLRRRLLAQAARELMLLSASDWQFLISTWSARDYAESRVANHHESFQRLADMAERADSLSQAEMAYLAEIEKTDDIFPDLDPSWFGDARGRA